VPAPEPPRAIARAPQVSRAPLVVWCLFVFTIPFYVFHSGAPQPGNMLVLLLVPFAINQSKQLGPAFSKVLRPLLWFTAWVCAVDLLWAIALDKWSLDYTVFPFFYIFNLVVFFVGFSVYRRYGDQFLRATVYTIAAAVVFQVFVSFFYKTGYNRGELFFNNPNQLGYYSLLAACMVAFVQRRVRIGLVKASLVLAGCGYLALLSASRAAVIGIALLVVLLVFQNPRTIVLASLVVIGLLGIGGPISNTLETMSKRTELHRGKSSFSEERGYDRLWKYPQYIVIGAGEGDTSRFSDGETITPKQKNEIHSSAATVIFAYGLIGALLFLWFVVELVRGAPFRQLLILMPPLLYTLAHQGLRFTMVWVMLGVFIAVKIPIGAFAKPRAKVAPSRAPQLAQTSNA
jgi:hypothetical protein